MILNEQFTQSLGYVFALGTNTWNLRDDLGDSERLLATGGFLDRDKMPPLLSVFLYLNWPKEKGAVRSHV